MVRTLDSFIRSTHLVVGVFACLFLLLYGLSGLQMATVPFRWTLVGDATVEIDPAASPRAIARTLARQGHVAGELAGVTQNADGIGLRFSWPGTEYLVSYREGDAAAHVRTRVTGLVGMLNRLHHASGLWHESGALNLWGVVVGLISVALLLLGATGLWLVFRIHEERVAGGLVLAGSLVVGTALIVAIRVQG